MRLLPRYAPRNGKRFFMAVPIESIFFTVLLLAFALFFLGESAWFIHRRMRMARAEEGVEQSHLLWSLIPAAILVALSLIHSKEVSKPVGDRPTVISHIE
jgi:hypothetical protein